MWTRYTESEKAVRDGDIMFFFLFFNGQQELGVLVSMATRCQLLSLTSDFVTGTNYNRGPCAVQIKQNNWIYNILKVSRTRAIRSIRLCDWIQACSRELFNSNIIRLWFKHPEMYSYGRSKCIHEWLGFIYSITNRLYVNFINHQFLTIYFYRWSIVKFTGNWFLEQRSTKKMLFFQKLKQIV